MTTIHSTDNEKTVLVGSVSVLFSLYSTVKSLLKKNTNQISFAVRFLESGNCKSKDAIETARQINLIRDFLARYSPDKAIWDIRDKSIPAPWKNNLSPVITSCSNLYTTADGKDLLFEFVAILTYAGYKGTDVVLS